jgi:hypothetical protein
MNPTLFTWIVIALGAVIISVIVLLVVTNRRPADLRTLTSAWRELSQRSRLKFTPPQKSLAEARLQGIHRRRQVVASVRPHTAYGPQGQQVVYYTRLEAFVRNPNRSFFRLNTKGGYRKTDQYIGQPVRPVDDAKLDNRFEIKCIPHDLATHLITSTPGLRGGLLALHEDRYVELELEGASLRLEEAGVETNASDLLSLFEVMCEFAEAFERVSG